ncbi:winged helix-turn-helix domain-containing protein [Methylocystis sp. MJC1]|jgi:DNA-binding winged helix-turn-helix (wHTH) protein|uniref:winged helix-turn-helix domain-containing protein n=1 Tax=Methylocystis sp. MJC1 TaxID=2654282 RepID=UPI001FEE66F3|nr:winged helix-turn-helix domain-containing protein [Methylocystis sp. MJC1]KAF2988999.1 Transcriptional regulator HilA [Methylocystis sp. MJC1]UZX11196.1 winged helix-turn-helix domain-containing protein [Methylocystis sp. MJC1]
MVGSVRFAGFFYSAQTGLQRDGVQIHLGPQARQLLELLLESNGSVVSKADIASRLWPDRPPSDDSIDRCAYLLRKPLRQAGFGDLIATAYGRGLSLRAKVEPFAPESEPTLSFSQAVEGRTLDLWRTAYELAGTHSRDGYARAQSAIAAAVESGCESPAIWSLSADIAAGRVVRGHLRPAQAAAMIENDAGRALALSPDFPPALAALGWARATLAARLDEGLEMLDRALARDPDYGKARAYRSWALAGGDRLAEAIQNAEAGLRICPYDEGLLSLRAWLELCAGDLEASGELARRGLHLRPDVTCLRIVAAIASSLSGNHDDAQQSARCGLETIPNDPLILAALSYVLARAGRLEEAEAAFAACSANEEAAPPRLFETAAKLALGRDAEARESLRQAHDEGCPWFVFASHEPRLTPLRDEISNLRGQAPIAEGG